MAHFAPIDGYVPTDAQEAVVRTLVNRVVEIEDRTERATANGYFSGYADAGATWFASMANEREALLEAIGLLRYERRDHCTCHGAE